MSKKTLVSAITAALVVGAASTTFAANNPFSDVPAENILATIEYFDGEETVSGQDASKFFANVDFFFW